MERELKPLSPCLVSSVAVEVEAKGTTAVDILFVIDNSGSMLDEHRKLAKQIPRLVETLASGVRADGREFPAAKDQHLGVVTTDMGVPGLQYQSTDRTKCDERGNDAILRTTAAPAYIDPTNLREKDWFPTDDCTGAFPSFITFTEGGLLSPTEAARQLGCLSQVGPAGCGFEMQLEAGLKALWPSTDPAYAFLPNTLGHGDLENRGFLREDSLLAVILVTDEEDCSAQNTEHLHVPALPGSRYADDFNVNLLCPRFPENLWPVQRYVDGLRALRPGREDRVIFTAIAGVPQTLVSREALKALDRSNALSRKRFYDGIRSDPDMIPRVDGDNLATSCTAADGAGSAYPPVRILDVVEGFGKNGIIQSICQDEYEGAIDSIIELITDNLGDVCLPRKLVRDAGGAVACNVVWVLPPADAAIAGTPASCEERGYLGVPENSARRTNTGRVRCVVNQLPVSDTSIPVGDGWYYDDFSEQRDKCRGEDKQRIAFGGAAEPPVGVQVKLECLNATQNIPQIRTNLDPAYYAQAPAPTVGTPCDGDSAECVVRLAGGAVDERLVCHPNQNVCVQRCNSDSDCPSGWVCDARAETLDRTVGAGEAICVNPTCGTN